MYRHVNSFALVAKKLNHHLMQRARKLGVHDSGKWDPVPKLFLDVRNCPLDRYSKEFYQISSSYSHNDLVFCDNRQKIERSPYRVNFTFIIKSMSPFAYRVDTFNSCAEQAQIKYMLSQILRFSETNFSRFGQRTFKFNEQCIRSVWPNNQALIDFKIRVPQDVNVLTVLELLAPRSCPRVIMEILVFVLSLVFRKQRSGMKTRGLWTGTRNFEIEDDEHADVLRKPI